MVGVPCILDYRVGNALILFVKYQTWIHTAGSHCQIFNFLVVGCRLEKEILDRYLEFVLKGNKDGLKVRLGIFLSVLGFA